MVKSRMTMTFFDVKQYKNYKIFTINFEIIDEKNFKNLIKNHKNLTEGR